MAVATGERKAATTSSSPNLRQSSKPPPRRPSTNFATTAWDISEQVLLTVTAGAQYAPTPYLGALSVVALTIFEAFQGAKDNRDSLRQLAYVACNLVQAVHDTYNELHMTVPGQVSESETFSSDPTLNKHVEALLNILNEIKDWIESHSSRPLLRRVIASRSDVNVIQDFKDQLKQVLDKFQLQSAITLRNTVSRVAAKQEDMEREAALRHESVRTALQTIQEEVQRPTWSGSPTSSEPSSRAYSPVPSSSSGFPRISSPPLSNNPYNSRNPFATALTRSATVHGNVSVTNVSGDHNSDHKVDNSKRENYGNVYNNNFSGSAFYSGMGPARSLSMSFGPHGMAAADIGDEDDHEFDSGWGGGYGSDSNAGRGAFAPSYSHHRGMVRGSTGSGRGSYNSAGSRRNRTISYDSYGFDDNGYDHF